MAFPTIPTTAANTLLSQTTSSASTTHTFPSLTTLAPQAGDLIIAICVQYEGDTAGQFSSWGASLTEILDDSTTGTGNGAIGVAYKVASGSESGTFTVTSADSWKSVQFLMRIPAATWRGTGAPEVQAATRAAGAVANPGSFNPSGWDTEDTLWISVAGQTETSTTGSPPTLDSAPTNFSDALIVARAADAVGDITAAVAFRQQNAASQDVGTWTATNANRGNGIATVIAVRPAASGSSVIALSAGMTTDGRVTKNGASVVPLAATLTSNGTVETGVHTEYGASVVDLTWNAASSGSRLIYGTARGGTHNAFDNGGLETNANNWGHNGGTGIGRNSTYSRFGGWAYKYTAAASGGSKGAYMGNLGSAHGIDDGGAGLVPGQQYTASCYVYSPGGTPNITPVLRWYDAAEASLGTTSGTSTAIPAGQWVRLTVTGTAPASTDCAQVTLYFTSAGTSETYYADGGQFEVGSTATAYVDTNATVATRFLRSDIYSGGRKAQIGAASLPLAFGVISDGTVTPGTTTYYGSAVIDLAFDVVSVGARAATGSATMQFALVATTSGRIDAHAAATVPLTLTVTTSGRRTTSGSAVLPLTLALTTAGSRVATGAATLPLTLQRTTAGIASKSGSSQIALAWQAQTAGAVVRRGRVVLPLTVALTTAGKPTRVGRAALPLTLSLTTAGKRTAVGSVVLPLTAQLTSSGRRVALARAALPLTVSLTTIGKVAAKGSATFPLTWQAQTVGKVAALGRSVLPLTLTITADSTVSGVQYGRAALPLTLTLQTTGTAVRLGRATVPLTVSLSAAGRAETFGRAAVPLTVTFTTGGTSAATVYGQVVLPLSWAAATAGRRVAVGAADLDLTVQLAAAGNRYGRGRAAVPLELHISVDSERETLGHAIMPLLFNVVTGVPFQLLDPISTGRIADTLAGMINGREHGTVSDTVGGVIEEDSEEVVVA